MEAPKRIYASEYSTGTIQTRNGFWAESEGNRGISFIASTKYIRADLVDRMLLLLNGAHVSPEVAKSLSELLGELGE